MPLDLNLLRVILAVYDQGGIAAAAHALGMSQPGLSAALQRARKALNDPLFLRGSKRMEPTERTRRMLPSLRLIMETVDRDVESAAAFDPGSYRGEFKLALTDAGEAILLPSVLVALAKHCPHADIRSMSYTLPELQKAMEEGAVDLALGFFPDLSSINYYQQVISTQSFCCLVSADHPLRSSTISRDEYFAADHVLVEGQSPSEELLEQFLARQRARRKIVLRTPHFMSAPAIVARTQLIATVPDSVAEIVSMMSNPRIVRTEFHMPRFDTCVYWHPSMQEDAKNRWLRRTLVAELRSRQSRPRNRPGASSLQAGRRSRGK